MQDDITLLFNRIDDRVADFQDRITRLKSKLKLISTENTAIRTELEDIERDAILLEQELGDVVTIQNNVVLDLSDQIRNNGLYVS